MRVNAHSQYMRYMCRALIKYNVRRRVADAAIARFLYSLKENATDGKKTPDFYYTRTKTFVLLSRIKVLLAVHMCGG